MSKINRDRIKRKVNRVRKMSATDMHRQLEEISDQAQQLESMVDNRDVRQEFSDLQRSLNRATQAARNGNQPSQKDLEVAIKSCQVILSHWVDEEIERAVDQMEDRLQEMYLETGASSRHEY